MTRDQQNKVRYSRQILAFKNIMEQFNPAPLERLLVLGCGNGVEAGYMSRLLDTKVFGVDVDQDFHPFGWMNAGLSNYDGTHLPFPDNHFDAIYSYHVLEHVEDVPALLAEVRRVIRPNGFLYIGVPNKSRLFGYMGMNDKSFVQKMRQNFKDWGKRLKGEWDNALGAHAGFREDELSGLLATHFRHPVSVTHFYYAAKWSKHQFMLKLLSIFSLDKVLMPSVYMLATD